MILHTHSARLGDRKEKEAERKKYENVSSAPDNK